MPYQVMSGDEIIGTHERVSVGPSGDLQAYEGPFSAVGFIYAAGSWDYVFWDDAS